MPSPCWKPEAGNIDLRLLSPPVIVPGALPRTPGDGLAAVLDIFATSDANSRQVCMPVYMQVAH
jgi:hypothetical protein